MDYTVFLGDVAKDEYYRLERLPQLGEKLPAEALPAQLGGMIANAASVYRSYGGNACFLSFLNPCDKELCNQLERNGIDTSMVQYDDTLGPSKCMICIAEDEHTVLIVDMKRHSVRLPASVQAVLCGAEYIYSNYWELQWLGETEEETLAILQTWYRAGVKLVCDLDVDDLERPLYQKFLPYTHTIFMNKVGFQQMCKQHSTVDEAVKHIFDAGLSLLVVTLAEEGCVIYSKEKIVREPAVRVEPVDVTGAGDTFCSSFVWAYQKCADLTLAARFATYAAARSITMLGARAGSCGIEPVLQFASEQGADLTPFKKLKEE